VKTGVDYWFGKNVLITGINGFIGGNMAQQLVNKGANVFGIVRNINYDNFLFYEGINEKVVLLNGDITDKEFFSRIIAEERIAVVFHLAAQVEVGVGLTSLLRLLSLLLQINLMVVTLKKTCHIRKIIHLYQNILMTFQKPVLT